MTFTLREIDLDRGRAPTARVMIVQLRVSQDRYFHKKDGLVFHRNPDKVARRVGQFLDAAEKNGAKLIVFPELSIPESYLSDLEAWSKRNDAVVVGGSHYHRTEMGYVARSPIVISGDIHYTHKQVPSPYESSGISGAGLPPDGELLIFRDSQVGTFAVLICSDYLDSQRRMQVFSRKLDILCVISCQDDSSLYHKRMQIDCQEAREGVYIAYCNLNCAPYGDGRSALFGIMRQHYLDQFRQSYSTDGDPEYKLIEIPEAGSFLICDLALEHKRPTVPITVHDRCNVDLICTDWGWNEEQGCYRRKRDAEAFRYRLVAFDLDGALIRGEKFSWTLVWRYLGDLKKLDPNLQAVYMRRYRRQRFLNDSERIAAYKRWCEDAVGLFDQAGLKKADFREIAKKASVTKNLDQTLQRLREAGFKIAIVSGGIDTLMCEMIPRIYDLVDRIYVNELHFRGPDEQVSGVTATRYDFEGKVRALEEMCDDFGIELDEVVYVADSFNDEAVIGNVGKAIAYSAAPDSEIETMSDVTIREDDLSLILPHVLPSSTAG